MVNGEAIYHTRPWRVCQHEASSSVFYTTKQGPQDRTYAIFTEWPKMNVLPLHCVVPTNDTKIYFLGLPASRNVGGQTELDFYPITSHNRDMDKSNTTNDSRFMIQRQSFETKAQRRRSMEASYDRMEGGIKVMLPALTPDIIPCQHAWVIVLTELNKI
jgi:alpha-L-fucosidase